MNAVTCNTCGGTVAVAPGKHPRCLFCGSEAVVPSDKVDLETPSLALPFAATREDADAAYRTFASSSFWYPNSLKTAPLELTQLYVPAWVWSGDAETYWSGAVSAATRSGKRPASGSGHRSFRQVLVPTSMGLTVEELNAIAPFEEEALGPWFDDDGIAHEVVTLSAEAARAAAILEIDRQHGTLIRSEQGLSAVRTSTIVDRLDGHACLVPVYVGVYRHGDVPYRVLINGQTGALTGDAPTSWVKIAMVAFAVVAGFFGLIALLVTLFG